MRFTLLSLAFVVGLAAAVPAQNPPGPPPEGPGAMRGPGGGLDTAGLGLTPDQLTKFTAIRDQLRQQNAPLREQVRQLAGGRSFRDLTPEARDSLRPKLQPIMQQMMANVRRAHEQIAAILTPEQRQKFEERTQMMRGGGPPQN